jgi:hypothetical protein
MGGGGHTKSAGTSEIARASGGDSYSVDDASALDDTLARLRQRYSLNFQVPPGAQAGQERNIDVSLSTAAQRRYPDAELRFRKTYISPTTTEAVAAGRVVAPPPGATAGNSDPDVINDNTAPKRRKMVSEPDSPNVVNPGLADAGAAASAPPPAPATADAAPVKAADKTDDAAKPAGWRKLKPGEDPTKQQPQ